MNAIILAAGEGKRMGDLSGTPKCLLDVNGKTVLSNAITCLKDRGVRNIAVVAGYKFEAVLESVGRSPTITIIANTRYAETNNMYSLWLASRFLEEGSLILDGDVFFEHAVLRRVLYPGAGKLSVDCWAGDNRSGYDGAMMLTGRSRRIVNLSIVQEPIRLKNTYKSIGIMKVSPALGKEMVHWLEEDMSKGLVGDYYDVVVGRRLAICSVHVCDITGLKWVEIDTPQDYERCKKVFR